MDRSNSSKLKTTAFVGRDGFIFLRPDTSRNGNGRTIDLILSGFSVPNPANCDSSAFVDEDGDGDCDPCADLITDFPGDVNVGRFLLSVADDLDDLALGEEHADNAGINFEVGDAFVFDSAAERFHLFWGSSTDGKARNRCPGSSPVVVERAGVDQWTVETTGNHLACLYSGENSIHTLSAYHGQVFAPFSATVVAQDPQVPPPDFDPPDTCLPPAPNTLPAFTCLHDGGVDCGDGTCDDATENEANCPVDCPEVP